MWEIGLVLWHVDYCRLFHVKSCLYIYIKYMICKHFVDNIFKQAWTHFFFLLTVKWFQLLFSNINNSIYS